MYAMISTSYWAHSAQNQEPDAETHIGWQPLAVHLRAVSDLARTLAQAARPADRQFAELASLAGWLHDFGKYSDGFQRMLTTGRGRPQHAIHGGMLAKFGTAEAPLKHGVQTVAAAIIGHHAGLADWNTQLVNKLYDCNFRNEAKALVQRARADMPEFKQVLTALHTLRDAAFTAGDTRLDLFVRMLFSCLVDADRLDSAGRQLLQEPLKADEHLKMLLAHTDELKEKSPEGTVKQMRTHVLEDCLRAAASPNSLFSLSVPTGGGKTLAAMAFALRRAAHYPERFRRIIVVIPYLSIIEQNADVYAGIFGKEAMLEHHSGYIQKLRVQKEEAQEDRYVPAATGADDEEEFEETGLRPETENWDAPLIVTTSVRFFESLFSNRPADLRRVHNIARSIVILDEVQTLPRRLLGPLLGMMKELTEDWGVNFVFSTATLPAFERKPGPKKDLRWKPGTITEIIRNPASLREALKRVEISWEIQPEQAMGWPAVAERMMAERQCLAIVNLRDHANQLYAEVLRKAQAQGLPEESIVHLSTRMCAAHRLRVLEKIRYRLKAGASCYVVSTQLVEAGVDLDFPLVLRALAPLDSIVQAAGRADREGKLTAAQGGQPGGKVIVFLPEENKMPPNEYKEAAGITEAIVKQAYEQGESIQVNSAEAMHAYFERYYGGVDDTALGKALVEDRQQENFATLADKFEMISSRTRDVFVPDDEEALAALDKLRSMQHFIPDGAKILRALRRTLQRHTVGLSPSEFERARNVLEKVTLFNGEEAWIAVKEAYDEKLGLIFEIKAENFVC